MSSNDIQAELGGQVFVPENEEKQDDEFKPLKPAWYPAEIEKAEVTKTKDEMGSYLKIQFVVLGEVNSGRKIFTNINLKNKNETCVQIGHKELATLCSAIGCPGLKSTDQLLSKTLMIKTAVKAAVMETVNGVKTEKYKADTVIKNYKAVGAATTSPKPASKPPVAETVASKPATDTAKPAKMPWE